MKKLIERLWALLPDECEVEGCCRKGVRGNENRIYPFENDELYKDIYIIMCDYCTMRYNRGEVLGVHGELPKLLCKPKTTVIDLRKRFRRKRK